VLLGCACAKDDDMAVFTPSEIDALHAAWRARGSGIWAGWSAAGDSPREVRLFFQHRQWRFFHLVKRGRLYVLLDDFKEEVWRGASLQSLAMAIEAAPD
jgi:hypothetical protein